MKKFIALLLALCMMAVMLPAFAALSFADSAATPAATAATIEEIVGEREKLEEQDSNIDSGEGFLDGNLRSTKPIDQLIGAKNNTEMMEKTVPYVSDTDGTNVQNVRYNYTYQGYTHGGISGGGVWFAVLGANLVKGQNYTLTILLGDDYYIQKDFIAGSTTLATESSDVVIFENDLGCDLTVLMGDEAHGIQAGDTFQGCTHDEHDPKYTFTVTKVDGKEVTMHSDTFKTSHTLLELTKDNDKNETKIALSVGSVARTNTVRAYIQFRENAEKPYGLYSARIIVEAYQPWLDSESGSASLSLSFVTKEGGTKTYTNKLTEVFQSINANGETYTPAAHSVLFGVQVNNMPFGTKSVKVSLILNRPDGHADTIDLGEASLPDNEMFFVTPGYAWVQGELNVTSSTGKNTGGESAPYLFDKTGAKYGFHSGGNDQTITWYYATAKKVAMYAIFSGNDTEGDGRNPRGWKFEGSMDGKEGWTLIDEQNAPEGQTLKIGEQGRGTFYTVENPASYRYYRITFKTNNDYFQIGEIMLFEKYDTPFVKDNMTQLAAPAVKDSNGKQEDQGLDGLFDDDVNTKLGAYTNYDEYTVYWSYDATETLAGYKIVTGADSLHHTRNPNSWTIYGSNSDGDWETKEWTALDTVTYTKNLSGDANYFVIDNPEAFQHYKIVFTVGGHQFQMADIVAYVAKAD